MIRKQLQAAFLDYLNNYLTPERFASDNGLTHNQAMALISLGRECHEAIVAEYKLREPTRQPSDTDESFAKRHKAWADEGKGEGADAKRTDLM